ncbi:hypothetical protein HZH66_004079 [Vespula vulgaris]|uniref:Uncharacterized protein n=1 Tax=Vespula vulgaris TaxID=7454 RepID=A0A834KED2_VESVU|nr:hypothetical protein HZH66_004079 [Vespula vulgaris]
MYLLHETLSHACPINEQLTGLRVRVVEPSKLGGRVICQYAAHPRFSTTKPIIAFAENLLTSLRWSLYSTDNNYISIIFTAVDHVEQGSPLTERNDDDDDDGDDGDGGGGDGDSDDDDGDDDDDDDDDDNNDDSDDDDDDDDVQ